MSGSAVPMQPAVQSELAAVAADLKAILANAKAAETAKKAELHSLVLKAEADLKAAKEVLGGFLPTLEADAKAVLHGAEAVAMAPVKAVKAGAVKLWHVVAAGGVGAVGGLAAAVTHLF